MKARWLAATAAAMVLCAGPALAQKVPENASEVARPGGTIAGGQKVALVKVADGFNDPVGVSVANDGSGRIFVVERVGRVKVVKGGKANAEPFLDLTNINPLGTRRADRLRRAGPVVDRLPSEVQGERALLRPLRLAAVQRRVARRPLHRRSEEPGRAHARADDEDRQGADEHPAALLQPLRRHDRLRTRRQALHRQRRRRLGGRSARRRAAARHASRQDAAHRRRHAR